MSTMRYRRFLAWTIPACVVWATVWVSFGTAAGQGYRQIADQLHGASYLFAAAIALFATLTWLLKRVMQRREERHMVERGDGDANTFEPD
jgi:membrane protein DedA with SNARE-associated domain